MKLPKSRRMTPLLRSHLITQSFRIKQCGDDANYQYGAFIATDKGTFYSKRIRNE